MPVNKNIETSKNKAVNSKGAVLVTQYICKALLAITNYPQPLYFIAQD